MDPKKILNELSVEDLQSVLGDPDVAALVRSKLEARKAKPKANIVGPGDVVYEKYNTDILKMVVSRETYERHLGTALGSRVPLFDENDPDCPADSWDYPDLMTIDKLLVTGFDNDKYAEDE